MLLNSQPQADLVLRNGRIWTVDEHRPEVEAVACLDGRIAAVGADADVQRWIGPRTRIIDLPGRLALPGFNDAHVHLLAGGQHLASVQLRTAASESDFRERIRAFAAKHPDGHWITGGDWDHENWSPPRLPTRHSIDPVTPRHPVLINRLDGHMSLANSYALRLARITGTTPDPPGGTIVRDAGGEPTGILKDAAAELVARLIPAPGTAEIDHALEAAMRYAAQNGVTSVQDMSASPEVLAAYQRLLRNGNLTFRVYGHQPLWTWSRIAQTGLMAAFGGDKLKTGALKGFADGSLGSTTALLFQPYMDEPGTSGLAAEDMIPESKMLGNITGADRAGLQVAIHAIGDRANHIVLGMFERAIAENGPRDRRFRIEHAQHLAPGDVPRFARLGVIASMQPYHLVDDGRWAEKRLGPERARGAYMFRSLLDSGAVLAFGSDWHVAPMDPVIGIYAAVTRRTLDGKHSEGWIPEQKITAAEAVRAFTLGPAYASFEERIKGSLEPGKLADIVVLSRDILSIAPAEIRDAKVDITIFDGKIVFDRNR